MQNIQFYTDYRAFLHDFYEENKRKFRFFSYRYFCKKAGIASPSLFREVVEKKRDLTGSTIPNFIKGLGLGEKDGKFFAALVHFNQSSNDTDRKRWMEEMRGIRNGLEQHIVPVDQFAYYSKWYNLAIRELACTIDWKEDYGILAEAVSPPIKKRQARESVLLLLKLGFLNKGEDGKYFQTNPAITTGAEVNSLSVREVNRQMAALGVDAISDVPPAQRDMSSLVVGVSEKTYAAIKQEIHDFKSRIVRIVNDDPGSDRVYNINVQLFPLSRELTNGKNAAE
jgi:uncharacterized protein (TIGR02147 family)